MDSLQTVYEFNDQLTPAVISRSIEDYYQFVTCGFIFLFQVGYFLFEYGSVRAKNAQSVLIKTFMVFILSCFATYSFGFAFAYGESYFIGIKYYFTSFTIDTNAVEKNEIKWTLLFACASLTAQLAMSGMAERSLQVVSWFYAIIVSLAVFPIVMGWTIGKGFM